MAKQEMIEIDVWVLVNDQGEYEVGCNDEECQERFGDADFTAGAPNRMVSLTMKVPKPVPQVVTVTVPELVESEIEVTAA